MIPVVGLVLWLLQPGFAPAPAEGVEPSDLEPPAAERELFETYLLPLPEKVQVAVAFVDGGSARFVGAERAASGLEFMENRNAVFEIGSITKVFTATLLAQEVVAGTLRLDQPVQDLVPFPLRSPGRDGSPVTLLTLANHTSGMCHQPPGLNFHAFIHLHPREPFRDYDRERFETFLRKQMKLEFRPGERYQYSNMGMSLVGYILARKNHTSYERLLQERIFGPLGMRASSSEIAKVAARVVPGLEKDGDPAPNWDMNALEPCGGILTSAADFALFVRAQFDPDPAIALTQKPTFEIEDGYSVGLGWHIIDRTNGERWLNHGGGMRGYTAIVNVNTARRLGVVVLSNLGLNDLADNVSLLGRDLLKRLEDSKQPPVE